MSAQLMCPNIKCRKVLVIPEEARGKVVKCSTCQMAFRVPEAKAPVKEEKKKSA